MRVNPTKGILHWSWNYSCISKLLIHLNIISVRAIGFSPLPNGIVFFFLSGPVLCSMHHHLLLSESKQVSPV